MPPCSHISQLQSLFQHCGLANLLCYKVLSYILSTSRMSYTGWQLPMQKDVELQISMLMHNCLAKRLYSILGMLFQSHLYLAINLFTRHMHVVLIIYGM